MISTANKLRLWGILLIVFIIAVVGDANLSAGVQSIKPPQEQYFRKAVEDVIGTESNRMVPHFRNMWSVGDIWVVHLNADEHADSRIMRGMIYFKSYDLFKYVFSQREDVQSLSLNWYYPLLVSEGHRKDIPVIKIRMSREKAEKVNWNTAPPWELPWTAESYFEHPDFIKQL